MKRKVLPQTCGDITALYRTLFFCRECSTWRSTPKRLELRSKAPCDKKRYATILSSSTAVNAAKAIPPQFKPLYDALESVKFNAAAYVNASRLRLAQQGLETEAPTTRVAILGLNVQDTARRIARLLLADALEKEAGWEANLVNGGEYPQGLIIKYGQPSRTDLQRPRTPLPELVIPASVLERNNTEILVSSVTAPARGFGNQTTTIPPDTFLSPTIGTPTHASGRFTPISIPVHSALVLAVGLRELLEIGELLSNTKFTSQEEEKLVSMAVQMATSGATGEDRLFLVDPSRAEAGLVAIRRSISEATTYEHEWNTSGMPDLSKWLTLASAVKSDNVPPAPIAALLEAVLAHAAANMDEQALLSAVANKAEGLGLSARMNLDAAVTQFSRMAHQELQDGLASAWSTRNWRKLTWYKLFWRVDDVDLIVTDLVTNAWLPKTERAGYELSGRLFQAGISPVEQGASIPDFEVVPALTSTSRRQEQAEPLASERQLNTAPLGDEPRLEPVITNVRGTADVALSPISTPIPISTSISTARSAVLSRTISSLTSIAQQLVLRTASITGFSGGLSALTYYSLTPGSLYEAGTIFALGTVFALWRMQGDWGRAKKTMEDELFDQGRTVIQSVVENMNRAVQAASEVRKDDVEVELRKRAQDAVDIARDELAKLKSKTRKSG